MEFHIIMGCHGKMAASAEWITMDDRCYWDAMWSSADNSNRLANENTGYTHVCTYVCTAVTFVTYICSLIIEKRKVNYRVHSTHLLGILLPFTCTWEVKTSYRTVLLIPCNLYCKVTAKLTN